MNHKKKNFIKVLLVILIVVIAGVIYSFASSAKAKKTAVTETEVTELASEEAKETESEDAELVCVHVCGSVMNPGVYYLKRGSRIHEAVELAGGMTEAADRQYVNLAREVSDGVQIYIPTTDEVLSGEIPVEAEGAAEADDGLVNINTAGLDELKTLPGIGAIKAEAILSYRDSSGPFASIEEIMNVAGIKESSYEKIKDHIKV